MPCTHKTAFLRLEKIRKNSHLISKILARLNLMNAGHAYTKLNRTMATWFLTKLM